MGNCYSENPGEEINILDNAANKPNRRAMAELDENAQPEVNIEELEKQIITETQARLEDFVRGLQTSHPDFYSQTIFDLWTSNNGVFDFLSQERNRDISYTNLVYKSAQTLADGSLYEGLWNSESDQIEGLGVRVISDGSLIESFFVAGKANGRGRRITHQDKEVYNGNWVDDLRHGEGLLTTEEGTQYTGSWQEDKKHGEGHERWTDGAYYKGQYVNGLKQG